MTCALKLSELSFKEPVRTHHGETLLYNGMGPYNHVSPRTKQRYSIGLTLSRLHDGLGKLGSTG